MRPTDTAVAIEEEIRKAASPESRIEGSGRIPRCSIEEEEATRLALTRDFKQTVVERVRRDPAFARGLLDEAATLLLNGEPETARLTLRDLVNATVGFDARAVKTDKPAKRPHRMRKTLKVGVEVQWRP